jgi:hypothetical protein
MSVRNAATKEMKIGEEDRNIFKINRTIQSRTNISNILGQSKGDKYNCPEKKYFIL